MIILPLNLTVDESVTAPAELTLIPTETLLPEASYTVAVGLLPLPCVAAVMVYVYGAALPVQLLEDMLAVYAPVVTVGISSRNATVPSFFGNRACVVPDPVFSCVGSRITISLKTCSATPSLNVFLADTSCAVSVVI